MDVSNTPIIERIARVLAAQAASINAQGTDDSAGPTVDETWPGYTQAALAVLKTLREPDAAMAAAGDVAMWERMVRAGIGEAE